MNIQNTYDSTSLSDLSGKLSVNGPPHFRQGDYTSLLSVRVVEDIFVADGVVFIRDSTDNEIIAQRDYNHKQFNNMNEFMVDFNECFKIVAVMSIDTNNKNTFRIQFKTGYEQAYIDYTGNLQRFLGKSTRQQIIVDGKINILSDDKDSLKTKSLPFNKKLFNTINDFIKHFNFLMQATAKYSLDQNTNELVLTIIDDKYSQKQITYEGSLGVYINKKYNVILNNEQLETSTLSIKYVQLKCDTLLCGMSSYQIDPITKQQSLQFGSNVLQVLCPNQMSYQSKNMDLHIKLLESMPLNFYIQDQDNNDIDVQYILQMRFYKQESFQLQSDSGVTAIHQKRQVFVYMSGDNRQFKLNDQFDQIALCQAYGNIGVQPSIIDAYVISYVYKLKVNDYKFDILHAYETNIENVNNSVFLWKQIPQDSILNFELETTAIEYTQYTNQKQQTIKVDQQPNILLRLFIK
ncbi:Hypothetical_protein [Hexamita inflata]|uniref:Hypothetical_protein n=1 Tax=Hexamita inflata TaxID=28002 RepID=A0AA86RH26_9EUKA|nr:Hypothetical protein HINF_LOCUS61766 [Hexamita inflata]